jgi:hypothetical protein
MIASPQGLWAPPDMALAAGRISSNLAFGLPRRGAAAPGAFASSHVLPAWLRSQDGLSARRAKESLEEEAQRRGGGRGTKGMYVRPSKALEVGGGFYVPGLEGYRLRVAIVGLVLTLLALNRLLLPGYTPKPSQVVSEGIVVFTALFVFAQALFDAAFAGGDARGSCLEAPPSIDGSDAEKPPGAVGARLAATEMYVDLDVGEGQRYKLQWLMGAALQTVQAGSSALVLGRQKFAKSVP